MARRRINTRFVAILVASALGVVALGFLANKLFIKEHPDTWLVQGREALAKHQIDEAVADFREAARLSPKDPPVWVELAKAIGLQVTINASDMEGQMRAAYEHALGIDPDYKPALQGLIDLYGKMIENHGPNVDIYGRVIDCWKRMAALDPDNKRAQVEPSLTVLKEWLAHIPVDATKDFDPALAQVKAAMGTDPGNAELTFYYAAVCVQQARDIMTENPQPVQQPEATEKFKEAVSVFEDALAPDKGGQGNNPAMHRFYAMLVEYLATVDKSAPQIRADYLKKENEQLDLALKTAKPDDKEVYEETLRYVANRYSAQGRYDEARKILEQLPDDVRVRLDLAELLGHDRDTIGKGIQLLAEQMAKLGNDPNDFSGVRMALAISLTDLRIQASEWARGEEKQKLLDAAMDTVGRLKARTNNDPRVLVLEARIQMMEDQYVPAIQILTRVTFSSEGGKNWRVQRYLAMAYERANQSSKAIEVLKQALQDNPENGDARRQLVHLLIAADRSQVEPYLNDLEQQNPDDSDVIAWRLELLAGDKDADPQKINSYYDRLPTKTPGDYQRKFIVARALKRIDDEVQYKGLLIKSDPKNVINYLELTAVYVEAGQKDKALEVVQAGLKENPDNTDLNVVQAELEGKTQEQIDEIRLIEINKLPPLKRQLSLAQLAASEHKAGEQEQHLKEAEKIAPDDLAVLNGMYEFLVASGRLEEAAGYIEKLAQFNIDGVNGDLYRINLALAQKNLDHALDLAKKVAQSFPEFAKTWITFGDVRKARGEYDEAIKMYDIALDKQENSIEALLGLVACYDATNDHATAMRYIEQSMKYYPNDPRFRITYINHLLLDHSFGDAIKAISEEIKREPQNPQLRAVLGETYIRVAQAQTQLGRDGDAQASMKNASDVLTEALAKWPDEVQLYMRLLDLYRVTNDAASAQKLLNQWLQQGNWKKRPEPYQAMADFCQMTNQPAKAEEFMHTAMVWSEYSVDLELDMARLLQSHGKLDDAIKQLNISENHDAPDVVILRVRYLVDAGDFSQAEQELQKASSAYPASNAVWYSLSSLSLFRQGKFDAALAKAEQALALDPNYLQGLYCRGLARLNKTPPDYQGAVEDLERARNVYANDAQVHVQLGVAYRKLNRPSLAIAEFEAALRLQPQNKSVRLALVELYEAGTPPRLDDALHILQDVDHTPPTDSDPAVLLAEARLLGERKDFQSAVEFSARACAASNNDEKAVVMHGDLLLAAKLYQRLLNDYGPLTERFKDMPWFWEHQAVARKGLVDTDGAMAAYSSAVALVADSKDATHAIDVVDRMVTVLGPDAAIKVITPHSKHPWAQVELLLLYQRKGDQAAAIQQADASMQQVTQFSKDDQTAMLFATAQFYAQVRPQPLVDKACDAYKLLVKVDPNSYVALNNLASMLADDYDPPRAEEALQYARRAVDITSKPGGPPPPPQLLDTEAWLLILSGKAADGIAELLKVIDRTPFPEAYYHLGEGYMRLTPPDPDSALQEAQHGLNLLELAKWAKDPATPQMRKRLTDLSSRAQQAIKAAQSADN